MIPVVKEKIKVRLTLTIPTDSPVVVLVNEIIDTPIIIILSINNIEVNVIIFY